MFETERINMVDDQIKYRGITDDRLLKALQKVERHVFVNTENYQDAYDDRPLSIGYGQTISQPYIIALMLQILEINETDKVLEIGTGSGYQTALLAELSSQVYTIERIKELYSKAQIILDGSGYKNIHFKFGDGSIGWSDYAPFDKIIIGAAAPAKPKELISQLKNNGRMVLPVGARLAQDLVLITKKENGEVKLFQRGKCLFVPLIGKYGWPQG